jgi:hypothetical protein
MLGFEIERVVKERLTNTAISYFVQGEDYERAIELCRELKYYYQHVIYDYSEVQRINSEESSYFQKAMDGERFWKNYFRVVYHGKGFDEEIRECEFVYRGTTLEPVMDFTNRIKAKFPNAHVFMSSDKPTAELRAAHEQIISITTLMRPSEKVRREKMREFHASKGGQRGRSVQREVRGRAEPTPHQARLHLPRK